MTLCARTLGDPAQILWRRSCHDQYGWQQNLGSFDLSANWLLVGVTFGNDMFVAVGDYAAMYSSNGKVWTLRTPGVPANFWNALTSGNGIFVAVPFVKTEQSTKNITEQLVHPSLMLLEAPLVFDFNVNITGSATIVENVAKLIDANVIVYTGSTLLPVEIPKAPSRPHPVHAYPGRGCPSAFGRNAGRVWRSVPQNRTAPTPSLRSAQSDPFGMDTSILVPQYKIGSPTNTNTTHSPSARTRALEDCRTENVYNIDGTANNTPSFKDAETNASSDGDDFHKELMLLCTRDGTPELARNTVYTLAQLLRKESGDTKGFEPLLKVLTSCQTWTEKDNKAIVFASECVLIGVRQDGGNECFESANEDGETQTPSPSSRKNCLSSTRKRPVHQTPELGGSHVNTVHLDSMGQRTFGSCGTDLSSVKLIFSYMSYHDVKCVTFNRIHYRWALTSE
ncbi:predicted protein [Phaeodactylum tricornutum CCAP 1055/1]|uniref:Uncharacterized protein n=1 Tax=Phaeodactylum tricornutum (strain CCAP 1055/1) TaxID=556484 RepID=B7FVV3_PHATC|nr:predicted protein [Phaeodactylum tricornutum CCAP 1055/1]EEC49696.1 predicted protein [Phaeodactylum tricornutum CCAP 1055/1]|eukprot:XP_002178998.1 predicted protein [Phaeodactylum tricornutum CCAP 1055/1]